MSSSRSNVPGVTATVSDEVLRCMEDPTDRHVMPPPTSIPKKTMKVNTLMLTKSANNIKNPTIISNTTSKGTKTTRNGKQVLDEDKYLKALGDIITRDFFPTLHAVSQVDSDAASVNSFSSRADVSDLSLTQFFNAYTSEDNNSFSEIHKKDLEEKKARTPWAYSINDGSSEDRKEGLLALYYMNNKVLTEDERKAFDKLLESEPGTGSDRPNGAESWKFRVRNQLMFLPETSDSYDTCDLSQESQKLITNETADNRKLGANLNLQKKEILHHNTSFVTLTSSDDPNMSTLSTPLEAAHTPSQYSESSWDTMSEDGGAGSQSITARKYQYVPMTPSPAPGVSDSSPMMTWGQIAATPLILRGKDSTTRSGAPISLSLPTATSSSSSGEFNIQPQSAREELARSLDNRGKRRKISGGESISGGPMLGSLRTPMSSVYSDTASLQGGRSTLGTRTSKSKNAMDLTPAARALAAKLINPKDASKAAPFGGNMK